MTIFYFTSTGNCFAVAKKIGEMSAERKLISIPQIIDSSNLKFKDDVVGLIFPIYALGLPKMVRRFTEKARWEADYAFAVGTYGNTPGAAMRGVQRLAAKHGNRFDYAADLLMVDNYLPGFDMPAQIAKLPKKHVDEHLAKIIADIAARKPLAAAASLGWRAITATMKVGAKIVMNPKQAQKYIVNKNCTRCGVCAKVCPTGNIAVTDQVTFGESCEVCLGCVHLCPQNAIHMKSEKSAARWRNPDVSLSEIVKANSREAGAQHD